MAPPKRPKIPVGVERLRIAGTGNRPHGSALRTKISDARTEQIAASGIHNRQT